MGTALRLALLVACSSCFMPLSDLWSNVRATQVESQPSSREEQASQSGSSEKSAGSDAEDSDRPDEQQADADAAELLKLRRQQQTSKARMSSLLSRQRKKMREEFLENDRNDQTADFQHTYFSTKLASRTLWWNPGEVVQQWEWTDKNRRRAVWLYFSSLASAVKKMFLGDVADTNGQGESAADAENVPTIQLVLSLNILDDTNIKLGDGVRGSSDVRSIMCNIQHHIVFKDVSDGLSEDSAPTWFLLHQPLVSLPRANAESIYQEFRSWLLSFCGAAGQRLQKWGIVRDLFRFVKSHVLIFISDALKANDSLVRVLAHESVEKSKQVCDDQPASTMMIHVHCLVHQAALTRRTLALGLPGFWSNLVRLGHLFESHNFRQRFHAAMAKVVCDSFQFVEVSELPAEARVWKQMTIDHLRLHSDHGHTGRVKAGKVSRHLKAMHRHILKDNGNPRSETITHFCIGPSCCANKDQARTSLLTSFGEMFAYMSVPLLYRWKHCTEACNFVREGCFFHRILPRTLEAMPKMQGVLSARTSGLIEPDFLGHLSKLRSIRQDSGGNRGIATGGRD